jgi:hypothetical protein
MIDITKYVVINNCEMKNGYLVSKQNNQYSNKAKIKRLWKSSEEIFYSVGLWFGDKYVYGNSVGLTNRNKKCLEAFKTFLYRISKSKIKESKDEKGIYRISINSAILRRSLEGICKEINKHINTCDTLSAFLAGLIDADGTIMPYKARKKSGYIKITLGTDEEIKNIKKLLDKFSITYSISKYSGRNGYDLNLTLTACSIISPHLLKYIKSSHNKKKLKECLRLLER